jgi:hypothetical protein
MVIPDQREPQAAGDGQAGTGVARRAQTHSALHVVASIAVCHKMR